MSSTAQRPTSHSKSTASWALCSRAIYLASFAVKIDGQVDLAATREQYLHARAMMDAYFGIKDDLLTADSLATDPSAN